MYPGTVLQYKYLLPFPKVAQLPENILPYCALSMTMTSPALHSSFKLFPGHTSRISKKKIVPYAQTSAREPLRILFRRSDVILTCFVT